MYSKYCGVVSEKIDVCPNVGWVADFGDPQAVLDVPFNGNLIVKNGTNSNWGLVNHPKINAAMEAADESRRRRRPAAKRGRRSTANSSKKPSRSPTNGARSRTSSPKTSRASASYWNIGRPGTTRSRR